jgi:hypothetical protein
LTALLPQEDAMDLAFHDILDVARRYMAETVVYRVRVGRSVVQRLYDGDYSAIHDRNRNRANSLAAFWRRHGQELQEWGLNAELLRRSVLAAEVAEGVSEDTLRKLTFSHLTALVPVKEPAWRAALLTQAADEGWSERELRRMIAAADAGDAVVDADPDRDGLQPLVPEDQEGGGQEPADAAPVAPSSVTRQMKATVDVLRALNATLARRTSRSWTRKQEGDAWAVVDRLEAELATVKSRLPKRG